MIDSRDAVIERLREGLRGRYTITGQVGRGGMATVYEAVELSHQRRVAMKVLRPDIAASLGSERFSREIRITANLSHPHILPVHEAGEVDGLLFYVMPFVDGESLRDRLAREKTLPVEDILRITREVGQALTYSHGQGVVHRDLKPENIMLAGGVAVVADFGIARGAAFAGGDNLTATGMALGTPAYMSPEQATGETTLDGRSDVYSLGCVVYEMLAGEPPFRGPSLFATLALHAGERIPDVRKLRPDAPPEMAQAITTALSKLPEHRFSSIADFVLALEGARISMPVRRPPRQGAPGRRMAAIGLGVIAVGALAVWMTSRLRAPAASAGAGPVVAVLPLENIGLPEDAYIAQAIGNEISNSISGIGGISVISRASAMQFDLTRQNLQDVKRDLKADYVVTGSVQTERQASGRLLVHLTTSFQSTSDNRELYKDTANVVLDAGELYKIQTRLADKVANALHLTLQPQTLEALREGQTTNADAYRAYLQGSSHAAQFLVPAEQSQAIAFFEQAVSQDQGFALAWARLAQVHATYYSLYDHSPARLARLTDAVRRADSLRPRAAETGIARGYLALFGTHDVAAARSELLVARKKLPNSTELLWAIGHLHRLRGAMDSAFADFSEAARLDPRSQMIVFEAATVAFMRRKYDESLTLMNRAKSIAPAWPPAAFGTASVRLTQGYPDSAAAALAPLEKFAGVLMPFMVGEWLQRPLWEMEFTEPFQNALAALSLGNPLIDSAGYYYNKGRLLIRRHQTAPALAYFDSLRTLQSRHRTNYPIDYGDSRAVLTVIDLAAANLELGDSAAARALADTAVAHNPMDLDAFRGSFALTDVARIYARLGERDKAMALLEDLTARPSPVSRGILTIDHAFDRLRADTAFERLVRTTP